MVVGRVVLVMGRAPVNTLEARNSFGDVAKRVSPPLESVG